MQVWDPWDQEEQDLWDAGMGSVGFRDGIHARPFPGSFSSQAAAPEVFQELWRLQVTQTWDLIWDGSKAWLGRVCWELSENWLGIGWEFVGGFAGNSFGRSKG